MKKEVSRICPFQKTACLESECQLWTQINDEEFDCAFTETAHAVLDKGNQSKIEEALTAIDRG